MHLNKQTNKQTMKICCTNFLTSVIVVKGKLYPRCCVAIFFGTCGPCSIIFNGTVCVNQVLSNCCTSC